MCRRLGYYHPSPLPPPVLCPWPRGPGRPEGGRSRCCSTPDSYAPARVSHGSDPSQYDKATVIFDGSPFTIKGKPLQVHRSQSAVFLGGNKGGWGGGMTQERGRFDWGGGEGEGVGNHMCK
jgi:hypothetical protein